jgi:hypothetical protein
MSAHDITRFLLRPRRHYSGVRMQQGRVLLDSDFNEAGQLHDEDRRRTLVDLFGPAASPDQGFSIGNAFSGPAPNQVAFLGLGDPVPRQAVAINGAPLMVRSVAVRRGSYYVGGQRVDLEVPENIAFQSDFLQFGPSHTNSLDQGGTFQQFYYLHVWEQVVSSVEDEEFHEVALGAEDTSVRVRRMRRVELLPLPALTSPRRAWRRLQRSLVSDQADLDLNTGEARSRGRLQIKLWEPDDTQRCGTCKSDPGARFLGSDNLTLRILLTSPTTFVWALDNAAPLYRVTVRGLAAAEVDNSVAVEVTLLTPPGDEAHFPLTDRVVELIPFGSVLLTSEPEDDIGPHFGKLAAELGVFTRVAQAYDPNRRTLTLDKSVGLEALKALVYKWDAAHPFAARLNPGGPPDERHFYMRVWHEAPTADRVELPIIEHPYPAPPNLPLSLDETNPDTQLGNLGISAIFRARGRRGDYWTVALRPEAPEPVTPFDLEFDPQRTGAAPHGPRHFYAPLAVVAGNATVVTSHTDARQQIRPLSDRGCVTFSVGDGITSAGDFASIQAAIDALPEAGGHIAVRPGVYRELLAINDREGVVLEGCGEATIIESPPPVAGQSATDLPPLIDVFGSTGIAISGFLLRAVEHEAVRVNESDSVSVSGLTAIAGVRVRGRFAPGALMPLVSLPTGSTVTGDQRRALSQKPLVMLLNSSGLEVRSVVLEPDTRPGLVLAGCDAVQASELTVVGLGRSRLNPAIGTAFGGLASSNGVSLIPVTGLVTIARSTHVTLRDSLLSGFGQSGVVVSAIGSTGSSDITIVGLSVVVSGHQAFRTGRATPSQSGVNIDGGLRVRCEDGSVVMEDSSSEHAGIVARGTDLVLRGNRVEALGRCFDPRPPRNLDNCRDRRPLAFGGIQIRGGSVRVQVRDNDVVGGIGHGITLGSVVWRGLRNVRREGAGRGQVQALGDGTRVVTGVIPKSFRDRGLVYDAGDEGRLREIIIADNRVQQMLGNGISVLSVLAMPNGALIDIDRLRIERNTIVGNLLRPSESVPARADVLPFSDSLTPGGVLIAALPLGGIVLGTVTSSAQILGNAIMDNGTSSVLPYSGIFILNGDGIVIGDNRITGNGGRARAELALRPGIRAGIAVMLAGTGSAANERDLVDVVRSPTRSDNLLLEGSFGDLRQNDGSSLRVYNNVVLHPEGRALYAVVTGPIAVDGNSFGSLGNHGANTLSELSAVGEVVFIMNVGAPWEKTGIDSPAFSTYTTPPGTQEYLAGQPPPVDSPTGAEQDEDERDEDIRYAVGDGGGVLFNNNQVTYDWAIRRLPVLRVGVPISFFPVSIISLDHVGLEGNQFAFRLAGLTSRSRFTPPVRGLPEPVLAHVFALGATVQLGGNRLSETVGTSVLSLLGIAELMLTSSYNQSTHQVFLTTSGELSKSESQEGPSSADDPATIPETAPDFVVRGAQVMFTSSPLNAELPTGLLHRRLRRVAKRFLELLLER